MNEVQLKHCPFCGKQAAKFKERLQGHLVECGFCKCSTGLYDKLEKAARAWNIRIERHTMTRAEIHKKYGITRMLPPKKLHEQLSPLEAEKYEKIMQATKEIFDHWDDEEYWKDMEGDID